jgi:arylsulfatase A-like enzyme
VSRRRFLRATAAGLAAAALPARLRAAGGARKPNVVLILADDLGYGDPGCYGNAQIPTPHVDSLAQSGVRCTDGYVSAPVCSPSRAGLLTGRYQQRFGHEHNPGPERFASASFGLPLSERTIADRLKDLGYATGLVGKWHLGYRSPFLPTERGFDEFFGFLAGAHPYLPGRGRWGGPLLRGTEPVEEREYLTDAFARESVAFIERHRGEPFLLYVPFSAVHSPLQAPADRLAEFPGVADTRRRTFAAMLSALDDGVGRILSALRANGLAQDTLVFFISDNGGPTRQTTASNAPFSGSKGQLLEGGIRVPFLVQWKGHVPEGAVYREPVSALDVLPTALAAAAGTAPQERDGVDLLPHLTGRADGPPHEALFWRLGNSQAVRMGDWKLVRPGSGRPRLFNVRDDVAEQEDLSAARPRRVAQLRTAYAEWNAANIAPLWTRQTGPGDAARRRRGQ